jgi:hypothetical protein
VASAFLAGKCKERITAWILKSGMPIRDTPFENGD